MREIIRAEHSGFCFGVRRALTLTEEQIELARHNNPQKGQNAAETKETGKIYTCGPLIHNRFVTDDLAAKGVCIIEDLDEAGAGDTVIVRSHGEPARFFEEATQRRIHFVNATCPFVTKIHTLVKQAYLDGYQVVIVGDRTHPEVRGISGWCGDTALIVASGAEALELDEASLQAKPLFLVCQTTLRKETMEEVVAVLEAKACTLHVENTICNATLERQEGLIRVAEKSDAMVIIGGKDSSNTRKLWEISKKICENSYFVEKKEDLPLQEIAKYGKIGVAAGASTPEGVIKEVIAVMSENITEMNMQDLMEDIEKTLRLPRVGEIVNGKVHQVTEKEIIVNMGCKKDGIIPKEEVTLEGDQKLSDLFHEGDEIQAKVVKTEDGDGGILLSKKKLEVNEHWNEILEANENKTVLTTKVVRLVNGGVIAAYKEVSGFIPLSQLSDRYVEKADEFLGQELDVKVTRVDQRRNRAVFSHKAVLAEEKRKKMEEAWNRLEVDQIVEGTVMRFTDYGAFIDLGGIDGLLHISEISWGKLRHPKEVLQIGDKVNVKILSMNEEKGKISLGLKQTMPEPWSVIDEKYTIGEVVEGKVVQIKEYGAFVELEPGLDGLVHISEVANKRVENIADELELGQVVATKILDIDTEKKRISLSIKQAMEAPAEVEDADYEEEYEEEAEEGAEE